MNDMREIIHVESPVKNNPRLEYTLDFINNHPFNTYFSLCDTPNYFRKIVYTDTSTKDELWIKSQFLFFNKCEMYSGDLIDIETIRKIVRDISLDNSIDDKPLKVNFDVFETIFFFISRYEEHFVDENAYDELFRFKSENSIQVINELHHIPIVDFLIIYLCEFLGYEVERSVPQICMTHDIDHIYKFPSYWHFIKSCMGEIKRTSSTRNLPILWKEFNLQEDPYCRYNEFLLDNDIEKHVFIPANKIHNLDPIIHEHKNLVNNMLLSSKVRNYSIGLHAGIGSYNNVPLLQNSILFLNQEYQLKINSNRFHYLSFKLHDSISTLEKSGITVDFSLGWIDKVGYRSGTSIDFYYYDFANERKSKILGKSMHCMDVALLREANNDVDIAIEIIKKLIDFSPYKLTFNIHNSIFFQTKLHNIAFNKVYSFIKSLV